jgi:protein-disulfide isomerase
VKRYFQGRNVVLVGAGIGALAIAVALILVSVLGSSGGKSAATTSAAPTTSATPTTTGPAPSAPAVEPKVPGAADTAALFKGIPQRLNQLGNPNAKVTMVEFADVQCPYCRDYAVDVLPAIVKEYVRTGTVKLVLFVIAILGADSEKGARAVYAAGLQGKFWNYQDLLYKSQGVENSGWVTDELLRRVGNSIPKFDTDKMMADRFSNQVEAALAGSAQQASSAQVNQTPTFFAGPTGGRLQQIQVSSLTPEAFRPTLDSLAE